MLLALGFFINGSLNRIDYREFIRTNALSHEHLVSAKHFLQRENIFTESIEIELMQWYSEFADHVMNTIQDGNSFDTRHDFVYDRTGNNSQESGTSYVKLMEEIVLPRIGDFQRVIREEIRFEGFDNSDEKIIKIGFQQRNAGARHEGRKVYGNDIAGAAAYRHCAFSAHNFPCEECHQHYSGNCSRIHIWAVSIANANQYIQLNYWGIRESACHVLWITVN